MNNSLNDSIDNFLINFTGNLLIVKQDIARLINYLKSTGGKIDDGFIKSLLDNVGSNKNIESLKVYEYFESHYEIISNYLALNNEHEEEVNTNSDILNSEIVHGCNDWLKACLDKLKVIRLDIKKRNESI